MNDESKNGSFVEKLKVAPQKTHEIISIKYKSPDGKVMFNFLAVPMGKAEQFKNNPSLFNKSADAVSVYLVEMNTFLKDKDTHTNNAEENFASFCNHTASR